MKNRSPRYLHMRFGPFRVIRWAKPDFLVLFSVMPRALVEFSGFRIWNNLYIGILKLDDKENIKGNAAKKVESPEADSFATVRVPVSNRSRTIVS